MPEVIVQQLDWEQLDSWITPNDQFFVIKHFNEPELDEVDYRLELTATLEFPGNTAACFFNSGSLVILAGFSLLVHKHRQ